MDMPSLADRIVNAIRTSTARDKAGVCVASPQALAEAAGCTMKEARKTVELLAKRGRLRVMVSPYWQVTLVEQGA
jgi:hypothetical protein